MHDKITEKSRRESLKEEALRLVIKNLNGLRWPPVYTGADSYPEQLLSRYQDKKPPLSSAFELTKRKGLFRSLSRVFRHYKSSRRNTKAFNYLYTFPRTGTPIDVITSLARQGYFVPNDSPDHTVSLIRQFADDAEKCKNIAGTDAEPSRGKIISRYCLTGPRGCGKTFYLNYLTTAYREVLHQSRLFWVRINLTSDFSNYNVDQRLWAQTIYIFREKYTSSVDDRELLDIRLTRDAFKSFINLPGTEVDYLMDLFDDIEPIVGRSIEEADELPEPGAEDQLNAVRLGKLANFIFKFLLSRGYTLLIIIDGLDEALPTTLSERRFRQWINVAEKLVEEFRYPAVWITSLRDESQAELEAKGENKFWMDERIRHLRLETPNVTDVLRRRFLYSARRFRESNLDRRAWIGLAAIYHYFVFCGLRHGIDLKRSKKVVEGVGGTSEIAPLESALKLYADNFRKLMSTLELCLCRLFEAVARHLKLDSINAEGLLLNEKAVYFFRQCPNVRWKDKDLGLGEFLKDWDKYRDERTVHCLYPEIHRLIEWRSHDVMTTFVHGKWEVHMVPFVHRRIWGPGGNVGVETVKARYFDYRSSFFANIFSFPQDLVPRNIEWEQQCFLAFLQLYLLMALRTARGGYSEKRLARRVSSFGVRILMLKCVLKDMWFFGLVERNKANQGYMYKLSSGGSYALSVLCRNESYLVGIPETTPMAEASIDELTEQFEAVIDMSVRRGQRFISRIRIAYLHVKYLQSCLQQVLRVFPDDKNLGAIQDMVDSAEHSLERLIKKMSDRIVTDGRGNSERYARVLMGMSLSEARGALGVEPVGVSG